MITRNYKPDSTTPCTWRTGGDKLNRFLQFNGQEVLQNPCKVKREIADALAISEYEKYDAHRGMIEVMDVNRLAEDVKKLKYI